MLTQAYIMKKVKEWAASPEGKAAIKEQTGLTYDPKINMKNLVKQAATDMKNILYWHIHNDGQRGSNEVIDSIKLDDIIIGTVYIDGNNKTCIDVGFNENNLHRDSLRPDLYDGIDNIILLHMTGVRARGTVTGVWIGHNNGEPVTSLANREPNAFMKKAVAEFNAKYEGRAIATLQGVYNI